jgi:hypothetical protein
MFSYIGNVQCFFATSANNIGKQHREKTSVVKSTFYRRIDNGEANFRQLLSKTFRRIAPNDHISAR